MNAAGQTEMCNALPVYKILESERGVSSTARDFSSVLAASISSSPGLLLLTVLLSRVTAWKGL